MTHPYRKKLIEVALPLAKINEAAAREKSIRHGHPSTLHLWWARRPLAACRAVLFASLVDDPDSDPAYRRPDGSVDEDLADGKRKELFNLIEELVLWKNSNNPRVINQARAEIARCVASRKIETGELAKDLPLRAAGFTPAEADKGDKGDEGDEGHTAGVKPAARSTAWDILTRQASPEAVNAFLAEHAPPVLDPFCGGGSIPLEAQRLGLRAYASDLNPVAVLITKALIEIPPKFAGRPPVNPDWQKKSPQEKAAKVWSGAQGLAEDVRYYGKWMRDEAEKRIGHLYPKVKITKEMAEDRPDLKEYVGEELTVIAWLWARTVASPNPAVKGAHVPLARSFWLSTKKGAEVWVHPIVDRKTNSFRFVVGPGKPPSDFDPGAGTVGRKGGRCILTGDPMPFTHIRSEGQANRMAVRLMAIVAEGARRRVYLSPDASHVQVAESAKPTWRPDANLPDNPRDFKTPNYGMRTFGDLFTSRQLVALTTFSDLVHEVHERIRNDVAAFARMRANADPHSGERGYDDRPLAEGGTGAQAYADAVATYLGMCASKAAAFLNALARWRPGDSKSAPAFGRQAIPMVWDFADVNPFAGAGGDLAGIADGAVKTLTALPSKSDGQALQLDSAAALPSVDAPMISTDPPYYDNIGYADLSDFFYLWLRRNLLQYYPGLFATLLTPKTQELIASPYRHNGDREEAKSFFEVGLAYAFARMRTVADLELPLTIYYAFKQAEIDEEDEDIPGGSAAIASTGWETMLHAVIHAGFTVSGTWPSRTEGGTRLIAMGTNALASSIVLVCRPRPADAALATRKQFITALRQELPEALRSLQLANIAPVDLAQAAIGPGMAVFTRYAKVMETDGSAMTVRTALGLINQSLDEVLAEQEGEFDGDTRWALAWFEQFGMDEGPFGVAETLSKAKNTAVNGLVEAGVVKARGGEGAAG